MQIYIPHYVVLLRSATIPVFMSFMQPITIRALLWYFVHILSEIDLQFESIPMNISRVLYTREFLGPPSRLEHPIANILSLFYNLPIFLLMDKCKISSKSCFWWIVRRNRAQALPLLSFSPGRSFHGSQVLSKFSPISLWWIYDEKWRVRALWPSDQPWPNY